MPNDVIVVEKVADIGVLLTIVFPLVCAISALMLSLRELVESIKKEIQFGPVGVDTPPIDIVKRFLSRLWLMVMFLLTSLLSLMIFVFSGLAMRVAYAMLFGGDI